MRTSFLFDPDQESPESLARRRELAEAILQRSAGAAPSNIGEGLSAIGQALGARIALNRVGKAEAAGRSKALESFNSIFGGGAAAASPVVDAVKTAPGAYEVPMPATVASGAKNDEWLRYANQGATRNKPLTGKLVDAMSFLPDLGVTMEVFSGGQDGKGEGSRRTGSTRHDHGNAADVYFYKDGRRLDWADAKDRPIFEEIVRRGKAAGVTGFGAGPGYMRQGSMHLGFGSPSVWGAGGRGVNAPDWLRNAFNGGGATIARADMLDARRAPPSTGANPAEFMDTRPGQVGAGVNPQSFRQPVQVASADPNFNYAPEAPIQPRQRVANAMMSNAQPGGQPAAQPTQMAQAQGGFDPRILEALSNPYLPEGHKRVLGAMLEQQMKQMYPDPAAALEMEYKRAQMGDIGSDNARADRELELQQQKFALEREGAMLDMELKRNPQMSPYERAQIEQRQRELEAQSAKLVEMSPGTTMFDPKTREPIYTAPRAETPPPAGIQEYEYAKQQGFAGTFQDWEASKRGGMAFQTNPDGTVSFQQGANIKPLTEGQSKDTVFATRAAGALPLIDQFGDALTSLGESVGGQAPIVGNYLKSEQYQQAENAGLEFLQAILRKDTGAAITAEEQEEYGKVYLPRPGDKPALLAQKKAARQRALEAIKAGMPPQALLYMENALKQAGGASEAAPAVQPAAPAQPAPEGLDMPPAPEGVPPNEWPTMWQMMTPEERALWLN